jgi:sugar phosphate permease
MGTALGFQASSQSLASMLASFIAGIIWMTYGSYAMFLFSALGALLVAVILARERIIE